MRMVTFALWSLLSNYSPGSAAPPAPSPLPERPASPGGASTTTRRENIAEWPEFRGPGGQGHAAGHDLPLTWSETENIAWKTPIPGLGLSSPVIQGKRIWLTTALNEGRSLHALCLDTESGRAIHDVAVIADNKPSGLHSLNSHATPTPIIEADRVYVHFGNYGTACLSTHGQIIWKTKFAYQNSYGPSSTPVLWHDLLIVPCQGTDQHYTVALEKSTGKVRWKQPHMGRNSESTPLVIRTASGDQVIGNFADRVVALDPATGKELWWVQQGNNYAQVPRPVFGHGLVYVCGGYFSPIVHAIRPDGRGDVTNTHVVWNLSHATVPHNPSPLLIGNELYLLSDKGILSCLDALTGKLRWRERLAGEFYASPLYADGRIYFPSDDGVTYVVAPGTSYRKLAVNKLPGRLMASLAVAGHAIYLRTDHELYRIEKR